MPTTLDISDISIRLTLALAAGAMLGIDRTIRGRPAGMRTTMMVSVAGAVSMVLADLVVAAASAPQPGAPRLDPLRMAQGVLAGMGFIGAGAIIRRDDVVHGVTTAATLWFATIVGLCFGVGEWELGAAGVVAGLVILWPLHLVEDRLRRERIGHLALTADKECLSESDLRRQIEAAGYSTSSWSMVINHEEQTCTYRCRVMWKARMGEDTLPTFVKEIGERPNLRELKWEPVLS